MALQPENLLEITSGLTMTSDLSVWLYKPGSETPYQTLWLDPSKRKLSFSIGTSTEIRLPALSKTLAIAHFQMIETPLPIVTLMTSADLQKPWHDDVPLPIAITVKAEKPLERVYLTIGSEGHEQTELLAQFSEDAPMHFDQEQTLLLEPFITQEDAEIRIRVGALDRHLPQGLVGLSPAIIIRTSSAYGRYREALATLGELKTALDESFAANKVNFARSCSSTSNVVKKSCNLSALLF
jgi:hypothetical protein